MEFLSGCLRLLQLSKTYKRLGSTLPRRGRWRGLGRRGRCLRSRKLGRCWVDIAKSAQSFAGPALWLRQAILACSRTVVRESLNQVLGNPLTLLQGLGEVEVAPRIAQKRRQLEKLRGFG